MRLANNKVIACLSRKPHAHPTECFHSPDAFLKKWKQNSMVKSLSVALCCSLSVVFDLMSVAHLGRAATMVSTACSSDRTPSISSLAIPLPGPVERYRRRYDDRTVVGTTSNERRLKESVMNSTRGLVTHMTAARSVALSSPFDEIQSRSKAHYSSICIITSVAEAPFRI